MSELIRSVSIVVPSCAESKRYKMEVYTFTCACRELGITRRRVEMLVEQNRIPTILMPHFPGNPVSVRVMDKSSFDKLRQIAEPVRRYRSVSRVG